MKDILKRWNRLAGTEVTKNNPNQGRLVEQDMYGNKFMKDLLQEDLAAELEAKGEEEEEEEASGDLGDPEKSTLSNSALIKGLKDGAKDLASAVPNTLNDEFAEMLNSVKELAISGDKAKIRKVMDFIKKQLG
jgi:hypothetical protein